jgi:rubredoxin
MPQIASHDESRVNCKHRLVPGGHHWRTNFLAPAEGTKQGPVAFLAQATPRRVTRPHFHEVDQFQVIVIGDGVLGKHPAPMHAVHFSRGFTPYGPIVGGSLGVGFLTLRAQWDPGAQYMADSVSREKLMQVPDRAPWQVTEAPCFSRDNGSDVSMHAFSRIKDDQGLAAYALSLKPRATATAPDPSTSGGQYVVVTKGNLLHQGRDYKSISIAFVKPDEAPMQLVAGDEGLEALVLHYPRGRPLAAKEPVISTATGFRVWQCALCAFSYDEARGMPEEGIAAGTRWEDVPETWSCPDCAASKSDFDMRVVG